MPKKIAVIFILVLLLILSSCAPEARNIGVNTQTPIPVNSQAVTAAAQASSTASPTLLAAEPQDTEDIVAYDDDDTKGNSDKISLKEQDVLNNIVRYPKSKGYGNLPLIRPEISKVDKNKFNSDMISNYLVSGLHHLGGYYLIQNAELKDGKLYIIVDYHIYVDPDAAYRYLKKAFSLSDEYIKSLKLFSETDCYIKKGHMYSTFGSERDYCDGIPVTEITFPQMLVANNATITIQDYFINGTDNGEIAYRLTTTQFADYILDSKNENDFIQLNNVWFKYSNGVITGIAEEYSP